MEHLDCSVVTRRTEQRQPTLVEMHLSNGLLMVSERAVRLCAKLEIVPQQSLIVRANNDVVTTGVDVKGRDPARTRLEGLDELLLGEIVRADVALCRHKEDGTEGMELDALDDTLRFAEGALRVVTGELMDCDGAVLAFGGDGGNVVTATMPRKVLDCHADSDHNHDTVRQESLADGLGPFTGRSLCGGVLLLRVCGGTETVLERAEGGLVEIGRENGGNHEVEVVTCGGGEDGGILLRAPFHRVDGFRAELEFPDLATGEDFPDADCAVVASSGEPDSCGVDGECAHAADVTLVDGGGGGREGAEVLRGGELGEKGFGVDVELVSAHSRCEVKIETALEALVEEAIVPRNKTQRLVFAREIVLLSILHVLVLPLLLLVLVRKILLGRVVGLVVGRGRNLGCGDGHDVVGARRRIVGPDIVERRSLGLFRLVGHYPAFADGAHNLHDALGFMFRGHEAALGFWRCAQRHDLEF